MRAAVPAPPRSLPDHGHTALIDCAAAPKLLAKAVELDGRSQLHKSALARALAEHDLRPHLDAEDRRMLHEHAASDD